MSELPTEVQSVILFGSRARGDADDHSDVDICLFVDDVDLERLIEIREATSVVMSLPVEFITAYPRTALAAMSRHGSLFLWHLKLECRILYDPRGTAATILGLLEDFDSYGSELELYQSLLNDVDLAVRERAGTEFDLHILFMILRNTAILLTYAEGLPQFGRLSAFRAVARRWPEFADTKDVYEELCVWHLAYSRGARVAKKVPILVFGNYVRVVQAFLRSAAGKLR